MTCCDRLCPQCRTHRDPSAPCWYCAPPPISIPAPDPDPPPVLRTVAWLVLAAFVVAFVVGMLS